MGKRRVSDDEEEEFECDDSENEQLSDEEASEEEQIKQRPKSSHRSRNNHHTRREKKSFELFSDSEENEDFGELDESLNRKKSSKRRTSQRKREPMKRDTSVVTSSRTSRRSALAQASNDPKKRTVDNVIDSIDSFPAKKPKSANYRHTYKSRIERPIIRIFKPKKRHGEDDEPCRICANGDSEDHNLIMYCDGCDMPVHQACYNVETVPEGDWFCVLCDSKEKRLERKDKLEKQLFESVQNANSKINDLDINPEFAVLASFLYKFGPVLQLRSLSIDEFEHGIRNTDHKVVEIIVQLLRHLGHSTVNDKNFSKVLGKTFEEWNVIQPTEKSRRSCVHEFEGELDPYNPFSESEFDEISNSSKVKTIRLLCEWQFDRNQTLMKFIRSEEVSMDFLRESPIGYDSKKWSYWLLDDDESFRIYRCSSKTGSNWNMICQNLDTLNDLIEYLSYSNNTYDLQLWRALSEDVKSYLVAKEEEREKALNRLQRASKRLGNNGLDLSAIIFDTEEGGGRSRRARKTVDYSYKEFDETIKHSLSTRSSKKEDEYSESNRRNQSRSKLLNGYNPHKHGSRESRMRARRNGSTSDEDKEAYRSEDKFSPDQSDDEISRGGGEERRQDDDDDDDEEEYMTDIKSKQSAKSHPKRLIRKSKRNSSDDEDYDSQVEVSRSPPLKRRKERDAGVSRARHKVVYEEESSSDEESRNESENEVALQPSFSSTASTSNDKTLSIQESLIATIPDSTAETSNSTSPTSFPTIKIHDLGTDNLSPEGSNSQKVHLRPHSPIKTEELTRANLWRQEFIKASSAIQEEVQGKPFQKNQSSSPVTLPKPSFASSKSKLGLHSILNASSTSKEYSPRNQNSGRGNLSNILSVSSELNESSSGSEMAPRSPPKAPVPSRRTLSIKDLI